MNNARSCLCFLLILTLLFDCHGRFPKRHHRGRGKIELKPRADWDEENSNQDSGSYGWNSDSSSDWNSDSSSDSWNSDSSSNGLAKTSQVNDLFFGNGGLSASNEPNDSGEPSAPIEPSEQVRNDDDIPKCVCVDLDQCAEEDRVLTSGQGLITWRSQETKECIDGEVCCTRAPENPISEPPRVEPAPVEEPEPIEEEPEEPPKITLDCGQRASVPEFIDFSGGFGSARFAEFPWVLKLFTPDQEDIRCGASLMHPNLAITAAHCIFNITANDLLVRAGEWDVSRTDEPRSHQDRRVSSIILHPKFSHLHPKNDIALILLQEPFELTDSVNTICPAKPTDKYDTSRCFATGWGQKTANDNELQNVLKKVELPIVEKKECQNKLRSTLLGRYFILDDSFMCAGGRQNEDTCVGDGGTPLMCPLENSDILVQVGIVSWGIDCGQDGRPGVYVDLQKFLDWIESTTAG